VRIMGELQCVGKGAAANCRACPFSTHALSNQMHMERENSRSVVRI
jgi:hypothetical protein